MATDSTAVRLVSGDGFSFIVDRSVAEQSATIRNMLDMTRSTSLGSGAAMFTEALTSEVTFPEIKGKILEKVCQYLLYKKRFANEGENIPEFGFDLEISLELLMAADYLDC
ncbi:elongin C [Coemansia erecta]|uniref:Elongin-C n=1 Tax=Coemansia erecta TaxID=147472 RepID=A0A9W7XXG4_9FUNG|nr:elongin C [Coemansia erecta]